MMNMKEFAWNAYGDLRLQELQERYDRDPDSLTDAEMDEMVARFDRAGDPFDPSGEDYVDLFGVQWE